MDICELAQHGVSTSTPPGRWLPRLTGPTWKALLPPLHGRSPLSLIAEGGVNAALRHLVVSALVERLRTNARCPRVARRAADGAPAIGKWDNGP